jgi:hypothetical protein
VSVPALSHDVEELVPISTIPHVVPPERPGFRDMDALAVPSVASHFPRA